MKRLTLITLTMALTACGVIEDPLGGGATFTSLYEGDFQKCKNCHAPDALGSSPETTLDFSTRNAAYTALTTGKAAGLAGTNAEDCNGVAFVGDSAATSLVVAVLDEGVRSSFSAGNCDSDAVTDMAGRSGGVSGTFVDDLKAWIDAGAPND